MLVIMGEHLIENNERSTSRSVFRPSSSKHPDPSGPKRKKMM